MGKHFTLGITETTFRATRGEGTLAREAALDGIYALRTSVRADRLPTAEVVRSYKRLATIERAFRTRKTVELKVRPIHHRPADRVRAHGFLGMLAYYVEWHMRRAWARWVAAAMAARSRSVASSRSARLRDHSAARSGFLPTMRRSPG